MTFPKAPPTPGPRARGHSTARKLSKIRIDQCGVSRRFLPCASRKGLSVDRNATGCPISGTHSAPGRGLLSFSPHQARFPVFKMSRSRATPHSAPNTKPPSDLSPWRPNHKTGYIKHSYELGGSRCPQSHHNVTPSTHPRTRVDRKRNCRG